MRLHTLFAGVLVIVGCDFEDSSGPVGGALTVSGRVVDFKTGAPLDGATSVTTSGLVPAPKVITEGSDFTITQVPENSAFQVLAAAPPTHRATFSSTVEVTRSDLDGIMTPVVSEALLAQLSAAFAVTPTAAKGVLFVRLTDPATGQPKAGIPASSLVINGAMPARFLDANLAAAPGATASSASGWAVFFEVPAGTAAFTQSATATYTLDMATSAINAGVVTIADARVANGGLVLPTNVSFATTVYPIFANRGCVACHSGGGVGMELGGLKLDSSPNAAYKELLLEKPNTRVQLGNPEASTVLRYPSKEEPPDRHPNITFASAVDPDYLKILVWIREGARDN
ncbi:MAG: hypothetical protein H0T46_26995 [Deltaproteobacteria bacterium]|nr:hypothetical protein [Deltaproteobacteria bacterium]